VAGLGRRELDEVPVEPWEGTAMESSGVSPSQKAGAAMEAGCARA